jgi:hypothetical protein
MGEQRENEDEYYAHRRFGDVVSLRTSVLAVQRQLGLSPQQWAGLPLRGLGSSVLDGSDGTVRHSKAVMGAGAYRNTDNWAIRRALKKKYQTNQELSDARADHAAQARPFRPAQCLETVVRLPPAVLTL